MRTIHEWLYEYNESHQNSYNKLTHWICVPAIMFSLLGLLWSWQTPEIMNTFFLPGNWALILILPALVYYFILSSRLAIGMLIIVVLMFLIIQWLETTSVELWIISLATFILAWIGQFIGHMVEGKRPSFFKDLQFLLIGPLWLLSFVYQKMGFKY